MKQAKRILIAAGGTGGHIFPGLSIANYLIDRGYQVIWVGVKGNFESKLVPKYKIDIRYIYIMGLRNKKLYMKLIIPFIIILSIYQAKKIIKDYLPDVVLGMGGFVSGPVGLAAWICGIPLIIHEQNKVMGLTNRWLSFFSKKVLQGFPNVFCNAETVGNPIRHSILSISDPISRWKYRTGPIRILVVGGSHGAHIFNVIMPIIAKKLKNDVIIWHQSGIRELHVVTRSYQEIDSRNDHKVMSFIDDMAQAYAWADILISRSGALTVSEVVSVGLPAIFVPFIHHVDRQQYQNAIPLVQAGAAKIIEEKEFTSIYVSTILKLWNRDMLLNMAKLAKSISNIDSLRLITQAIINI